MAKSSNPLYVVTNKGKDVQEAESLLDALVKKLHLQPFIDLLMELWLQIVEQFSELATNYSMFLVVKSLLDEWIDKLLAMAEKIGFKPSPA